MENVNIESQEISENKKSNKFILIGIIVVLILGITVYFFSLNKNTKNSQNNQNDSQIKTYTLDEVKKNNSNASCWTVIDNNVYDVTKFISIHKGGDRILAVCGIDGTDLFTGKSSMGRVHSDMAKTILSKMLIGKIQK